jgi:hypothetical protein
VGRELKGHHTPAPLSRRRRMVRPVAKLSSLQHLMRVARLEAQAAALLYSTGSGRAVCSLPLGSATPRRHPPAAVAPGAASGAARSFALRAAVWLSAACRCLAGEHRSCFPHLSITCTQHHLPPLAPHLSHSPLSPTGVVEGTPWTKPCHSNHEAIPILPSTHPIPRPIRQHSRMQRPASVEERTCVE